MGKGKTSVPGAQKWPPKNTPPPAGKRISGAQRGGNSTPGFLGTGGGTPGKGPLFCRRRTRQTRGPLWGWPAEKNSLARGAPLGAQKRKGLFNRLQKGTGSPGLTNSEPNGPEPGAGLLLRGNPGPPGPHNTGSLFPFPSQGEGPPLNFETAKRGVFQTPLGCFPSRRPPAIFARKGERPFWVSLGFQRTRGFKFPGVPGPPFLNPPRGAAKFPGGGVAHTPRGRPLGAKSKGKPFPRGPENRTGPERPAFLTPPWKKGARPFPATRSLLPPGPVPWARPNIAGPTQLGKK